MTEQEFRSLRIGLVAMPLFSEFKYDCEEYYELFGYEENEGYWRARRIGNGEYKEARIDSVTYRWWRIVGKMKNIP